MPNDSNYKECNQHLDIEQRLQLQKHVKMNRFQLLKLVKLHFFILKLVNCCFWLLNLVKCCF